MAQGIEAMRSKLRHGRTAILGAGMGIMFTVLWLRGTPGLGETLDALRDGALLLLTISLGLSLLEWKLSRSADAVAVEG